MEHKFTCNQCNEEPTNNILIGNLCKKCGKLDRYCIGCGQQCAYDQMCDACERLYHQLKQICPYEKTISFGDGKGFVVLRRFEKYI